jgi:O-antigen/teichoic acid export membrane protein
MFAAIIVARFFGYLFQIYVARALGPEEYSVFGSLFSVFLILTIPVGTIQTVIARFTSEYRVNNAYGKIRSLMVSALKKLSRVGVGGFFLMGLASFPLAWFLKIPTPVPIMILALSVIFSFVAPVTMGVLLGLQNFRWLGFTMSLQTGLRLAIVVPFIFFGFGINGVMFSFSLAYLFPLLLSLIPLIFLFKEKNDGEKLEISEIYRYTYPVLITMGMLLLVQNIDVILVKHFFTSEEAGFYVAASNIGKIIVFLGSGLAVALFPKVSERHSRGKPTFAILRESWLCMLPLSALFIGGCTLLNEFITILLFGSAYLSSASLLPYFATAMSFLGIAAIIFRYLTALKEFTFLIPLVVVALAEVAALFFFHTTLNDVLLVLNIVFFSALVVGVISLVRIKE